MSDFFALPEVRRLQEVQKRNPYGSAPHREAHEAMVGIAGNYLAQGRNELVRCSMFFGDY